MTFYFFWIRFFIYFGILMSFCCSITLSANLTPYLLLSSKIVKKKQIKINLHNIINAHSTGFLSDNGIITAVNYKKSQVSMPHLSGTYINQKKLAKSTGKSLDIALLGDGYFKFLTNKGIRYSCNGELKILNGVLVNKLDNPILDDQEAIIEIDCNFDNIKFARKGEIVLQNNQTNEIIARIAVVRPTNVSSLRKEGNGMFINLGEEVDSSNFSILQGSLNTSNADVSRAYSNTQREIAKYKEHNQMLSAFLNTHEADTAKLSSIG